MKKIYLYIIIAVIVAGTGGYIFLSKSNGKEVKYRTDKVSRGNVVVQVRATGTINPVQTVQVGSQVSGTVSKLNADFNSIVRKGEIIALIDSTFLYAAVKQQEANLERSQAQLNEAKRIYERTKELFNKQLVSQADLDATTASYESAVAQLKQSQASLDQSRVNLRFAIIKAPIDGVVISRDVDVGQTVAASLQAPKLFVIANNLKQMRVEASVDEADIGQIKEGQSVTFTVDAYPEDQFNGEVSQVRLNPVNVQNVVTYIVIITVPNPELKLRPGMTATVSILVDERTNALRVPTLAVRFQPPMEIMQKFMNNNRDTNSQTQTQRQDGERQFRGERGGNPGEGGGRMRESRKRDMSESMMQKPEHRMKKMSRVWILENGNLKPISVRSGLNDSRYTELITDSLKEGDDIVIGMMEPEGGSPMGQQSNPFQPRMQGGGGGRGRF